MKRQIFRVEQKAGKMSEKEICEFIDFWYEASEDALQVYKTAVLQHNHYQHLLLKLKTGIELKD